MSRRVFTPVGRKYWLVECRRHNMYVRTSNYRIIAGFKSLIHYVHYWSYHNLSAYDYCNLKDDMEN